MVIFGRCPMFGVGVGNTDAERDYSKTGPDAKPPLNVVFVGDSMTLIEPPPPPAHLFLFTLACSFFTFRIKPNPPPDFFVWGLWELLCLLLLLLLLRFLPFSLFVSLCLSRFVFAAFVVVVFIGRVGKSSIIQTALTGAWNPYAPPVLPEVYFNSSFRR